MVSRLLRAALEYNKRGWSVLPLHSSLNGICTCGRSSCQAAGKHPRIKWRDDGVLRQDVANQDMSAIREWFTRWPDSNVGILTGEVSGLVVLDVDGQAGQESIARFEIPDAPQVLTGKGRHIYFAHPGVAVRNSVGLMPGIDLRGDGGLVVAPPSRHANGNIYTWARGTRDLYLPVCPEWLQNRLQQPTIRKEAQTCHLEQGRPIYEGSRNDALFRIGCSRRRRGLDDAEIAGYLFETNDKQCIPPLPSREVERIIAQVCRYPKGETL